jgi:IclR family acetate operon transcriptional repressor
LQERGYVYEISPRGGYYLTLRLHDIGCVIAENDPILLRAEHLLRELRDVLEESVLLAKVNGLTATYLLTFETPHPLRFQQRVGNAVTSLHATSAGRAILASLDIEQREQALAAIDYTAFTPNTARNAEALRERIKADLARGYFVNVNESIDGLSTISATFKWQQSLYIVTVAGSSSRLAGRLEEASRQLLETCNKLEMRFAK